MDEKTHSYALRAAITLVVGAPLLQQILDFTARVLLHDKEYHGDDKIIWACVGAVLTIIYHYYKKAKS